MRSYTFAQVYNYEIRSWYRTADASGYREHYRLKRTFGQAQLSIHTTRPL